MKKSNFIINVLIVGIALFSVVALLLFRVKFGQLQDEKEILESQIASYSEKIVEIENLINQNQPEP